MKRWAVFITAITFCAALACAQEGPSQDQVFSSDLIAWSGMQQPQAPEQPGQQTAPTDSQNTDSQNQAPAASSFTGTMAKEADGLVLKVSETTTYKLDAQRQVERYEGQRVRVTGTLESGVNLIHVDRIEPMS
jgi:glucose/arabinose dehydrogenase